MAEQINLRLPSRLLTDARRVANKRGYGNVQAFITETVRDAVYDEEQLTPREMALIDAIIRKNDEEKSWVTKDAMMKKLKSNIRKET